MPRDLFAAERLTDDSYDEDDEDDSTGPQEIGDPVLHIDVDDELAHHNDRGHDRLHDSGLLRNDMDDDEEFDDTTNNTSSHHTSKNNNNNHGRRHHRRRSSHSYKVYSWNCYGIPYANFTMYLTPLQCSKYAAKVAKQHELDAFDGLILWHFQELWAFRTGLMPPFILRLMAYIEYIPVLGTLISWCFSTAAFLMGMAPLLSCLPLFKYDPKYLMVDILKDYLPYSVIHSEIPFYKPLDNGLLILSNEKPDRTGFEAYDRQHWDDAMAHKGILWAYFEKRHLLVINTHLQAAGADDIRVAQLEQMADFLHRWQQTHGELKRLLIAGDFNIDLRSNAVRMLRNEAMKELGFGLSTHYEGSVSHDPYMQELRTVEILCDEDLNDIDNNRRFHSFIHGGSNRDDSNTPVIMIGSSGSTDINNATGDEMIMDNNEELLTEEENDFKTLSVISNETGSTMINDGPSSIELDTMVSGDTTANASSAMIAVSSQLAPPVAELIEASGSGTATDTMSHQLTVPLPKKRSQSAASDESSGSDHGGNITDTANGGAISSISTTASNYVSGDELLKSHSALKHSTTLLMNRDSSEALTLPITSSSSASKSGGHGSSHIDGGGSSKSLINLKSYDTYCKLHTYHSQYSSLFGTNKDLMRQGCADKLIMTSPRDETGARIGGGSFLSRLMNEHISSNNQNQSKNSPLPLITDGAAVSPEAMMDEKTAEEVARVSPAAIAVAASSSSSSSSSNLHRGGSSKGSKGASLLRKNSDSAQVGLASAEGMLGSGIVSSMIDAAAITKEYMHALVFPADHSVHKNIGRGVLRKNYLPICEILNVKKLNTYEPTMKRHDWNIDHVLVLNDMRVRGVKNGIYARHGPLSDHFLVMTQFEEINSSVLTL